MGLIAETCKESFTKNIDESMKMACAGLLDPHMRVRYGGLSCVALLLTEMSPIAQKKYHADLMKALMSMMTNETVLKMKTHAVSTMINFCKGLIDEDEDEVETTKKNSTIMNMYAEELLTILVNLLNIAMENSFIPLCSEVLDLLSLVASIIESKFAKYYNHFTPLLLGIFAKMPMTTVPQQTMRAKIITTLGFLVQSVSESKEQFKT